MATNLTTNVQIRVNAILESGVTGESGGVLQSMLDEVIQLVNGNGGAGQANRSYFGTRSLAGAASESLDVRGVLADSFANTLNFANIKLIAVKVTNTSDTGVDLRLGPAAANGFGIGPIWNAASAYSVCPEGGIWFWFDPYTGAPATAGTADIMTAANAHGSTTITYRILIIGSI